MGPLPSAEGRAGGCRSPGAQRTPRLPGGRHCPRGGRPAARGPPVTRQRRMVLPHRCGRGCSS
eukprot:845417-Alexandrium_andersonii.AAC.1